MTLGKRSYLLISAGIVLAGFLLRLAPIAQNRFHEDEALYATWSRQIAAGVDPLLDRAPVDKPPLLFYMQALSFLAFGPSEVAARLPNLLASLAGMLLLWGLAGRIYGRSVALLATLALAFNPFDIAFAATAFTDPLMTAWVLAGLFLAAGRRPGWAGVCLGLAFATKQQGLFFVPLALGIALLWPAAPSAARRTETPASGRAFFVTLKRAAAAIDAVFAGRPLARGALGLLVGGAPALIWDAVRAKTPGYLAQSLLSYGGLHLAPWSSWAERAGDWLEVLKLTAGWPLLALAGGLLALIVADGVCLIMSRRGEQMLRFAQHDKARGDLLLAGFILLYLLAHWLFTFRAWDRYLLGLIPLLMLLAARAALLPARLLRRPGLSAGYLLAAAALLVVLAWPAASMAARGQYPAGGDHGVYQGIEQVAAYVRAEIPPEAIIHQRHLGWHFGYYLWGYPHAFRWYSTRDELLAHATEWPAVPQWIVLRAWDDDAEERAWLASAGLRMQEEYRARRPDGSVSFRIYRLTAP